jgi:hypothetical protein
MSDLKLTESSVVENLKDWDYPPEFSANGVWYIRKDYARIAYDSLQKECDQFRMIAELNHDTIRNMQKREDVSTDVLLAALGIEHD